MTTAAVVEHTHTDSFALDEPLTPCFFCKDGREPSWVIRYDHCGHNHLACGSCKERIVRRQAEADEATPPRPYGRPHVCCGATIHRATCTPL